MRFTPLYCKTFTDNKFKSLSTEAKLLFLYLISHEQSGLTGIFDIDISIIDVILRLKDTCVIYLKELVTHNMIKFDSDKNLVWVINKFKYNPSRSPSIIQKVISDLQHVDHYFKKEFIEKYKDILGNSASRLSEHSDNKNITIDEVRDLFKINYKPDGIRRYFSQRGISYSKINAVIEKVMKER